MNSYNKILQTVIPNVDYHQNHYARMLDREVRANCRWLDLGAGVTIHGGFGVTSPAELASRASLIVGADPEMSHLRDNDNVSYAVGAIGDALPFAESTFDLVSANMVVEHLEEPQRVFREVLRILKPGGVFVFVTPNRNHPIIYAASVLLSRAARKAAAVSIEERDAEHVFPTYYRANTRSCIVELAHRTGFRAAEVHVHRNIPFFKRPTVAVLLESIFIRVTELGPLQGMGADIVAVLQKG